MTVDIPELQKINRGKVREIFALNEDLLIVTTDRISAYDCVLPSGVPNKGMVLNQISLFWFRFFQDVIPGHVITGVLDEMPESFTQYRHVLRGRSMLVRKAEVLPVECIVRGYLAGSGWREYRKSGTVCGLSLPAGLKESSKLPEPIFTPSTKAESGHDENISFEEMCCLVGNDIGNRLRVTSIDLYKRAAEYALERGIIIADTKFEFGFVDGVLILVDEVLSPDSSRFWPQSQYREGRAQPSFDKQFVRDYLDSLGWDHVPPVPELPESIAQKTSQKYLDAFRLLTGTDVFSMIE